MLEEKGGPMNVKEENLATVKRPSKRERVVGAYLITDPVSGKVYAGSSGNIGARMREHRSTIQNGTHSNVNMRELMVGRQVSELVVQIVECENREEAFVKEQHLLDRFSGTDLLLNRAKDSQSNRSFNWTEKERTAQSERLKGHIKSPETCERLSRSLTGRKFSNAHRDSISASAKVRANQGLVPQLIQQAQRSKKPVVIDEVQFESAAAAATHFGLKETTMLYRLSSTSKQFQNWRYKENNE